MRYNMSNYDDPERRYSCFSEPTQVLRRHPHSLSLIVVYGNLWGRDRLDFLYATLYDMWHNDVFSDNGKF